MKVCSAYLFLISLFAAAGTYGQVRVPLRIDTSATAFTGTSLFCNENDKCGLLKDENYKTGSFDSEKIPISVMRSGPDFLLRVDTNRNNKLTDEKDILVKNGAKAEIRIMKQAGPARPVYLPFELSHFAQEKGGETVDQFMIAAHYAAAGKLKYQACSVKISVLDMDRNGRFTLADAAAGTNFQIDINNDGNFWGKNEFHSTDEIIEFCGRNFLVNSLSNSQIDFTPTDLKLAKPGEMVPRFSFTLLSGTTLTDDTLKGKIYVLDFWASWCVPCVKNLPQITRLKGEYKDRVNIYSINVDVASKRKQAEEIIRKYDLTDLSAIRGFGDDDPFWKTFGGANLNRLSVPLYVLVDDRGTVLYAAHGGEGLGELTSVLEKLLSK